MALAPRRRRYDPALLDVVERLLVDFTPLFSAGVVLRAVETARSAVPFLDAPTVEALARQDLQHRAARRQGQ